MHFIVEIVQETGKGASTDIVDFFSLLIQRGMDERAVDIEDGGKLELVSFSPVEGLGRKSYAGVIVRERIPEDVICYSEKGAWSIAKRGRTQKVVEASPFLVVPDSRLLLIVRTWDSIRPYSFECYLNKVNEHLALVPGRMFKLSFSAYREVLNRRSDGGLCESVNLIPQVANRSTIAVGIEDQADVINRPDEIVRVDIKVTKRHPLLERIVAVFKKIWPSSAHEEEMDAPLRRSEFMRLFSASELSDICNSPLMRYRDRVSVNMIDLLTNETVRNGFWLRALKYAEQTLNVRERYGRE